jgi:FkbH-like protein
MTIAMIGDCLMNETLTFLDPVLRSAGVDLTARHTYFSTGQRIALDTEKMKAELATHNFDLLFLSFLTFEGLPPYRSLLGDADGLSPEEVRSRVDALLAVIFNFISEVREETAAPIVLHGCSGLPLTHARLLVPFASPLARATRRVTESLDAGLRDIASAIENTLFLDEAELVRSTGFRAASRRILPRWVTHRGPFHPSRLGTLLASEYAKIAQAYLTLAKTKVLLVDFDNTLWAGVVGEGDVVHDVQAQEILKELQMAGILLVAVSKNDPESIRWDEMFLKPDDFALHKINWNPKPQSVEEIAAQLDLDPSSFVLIDDNPVERELVSQAWPSVRTLDPADPSTWDQLQMMLAFPNTRRTEEAARRTEIYREAAARREAITGTVDYASMMAGLCLTAGWRLAGLHDVDRVQELMSRTSQFNTTTLRPTKAEVADLVRSPDADVWVATLSDRFGDLGLVGVVITTRKSDRLVFDAVVMSCRAMGFGLENLLVRAPIDAATGRTEAIGRFVPTQRNSPCAGLFRDLGFDQHPDGNWRLDLDGELPEVPDWLTVRS